MSAEARPREDAEAQASPDAALQVKTSHSLRNGRHGTWNRNRQRLSSESEIRKRYNPQTAAARARPCERRTDGIDSPIAQLVRALH